jgi:uncharacterized protein (TIGR02118 family)
MSVARSAFLAASAAAPVAVLVAPALAAGGGAVLVAAYKTPADPKAFTAYYFGTHAPKAKTLPGLLSYVVSEGAVATPAGPSPYYLMAELRFESMAALNAALASPTGTAVVDDLKNFASAGVDITMFEYRPV